MRIEIPQICLITLHGLPTATTSDGISFVTTDPAPMVTLSPIVTPGSIAFTHAYLLSVVAVERLIDDYIVISDVAKQTLEDVSIFSFSVMMSSFIDIIYQVFLVTDLEIDSFAIACQI